MGLSDRDGFSRREEHADWSKELDKTSFQVLRKKGTEPAGTGEYDKFYPTEGHFVCKGCGNPLYSAESKFNSGCGWYVVLDLLFSALDSSQVKASLGKVPKTKLTHVSRSSQAGVRQVLQGCDHH